MKIAPPNVDYLKQALTLRYMSHRAIAELIFLLPVLLFAIIHNLNLNLAREQVSQFLFGKSAQEKTPSNCAKRNKTFFNLKGILFNS